RQLERDRCRCRWAAAQADERRLAEHRLRVETQRQAQRQPFGRGPIDSGRLCAAAEYERTLGRQIESLAESQRALAAEIARCQETLSAAEREVQALEKLRDRQLAQFVREQALHEARDLDEMAGRVAGVHGGPSLGVSGTPAPDCLTASTAEIPTAGWP